MKQLSEPVVCARPVSIEWWSVEACSPESAGSGSSGKGVSPFLAGIRESVGSCEHRWSYPSSMSMPAFVSSTADMQSSYRYSLTRVWDESLPSVTFVLLNPSTADDVELDPTLRRCIGFARR